MDKNKSSTPAERELIWKGYGHVGCVSKVVKALSLWRRKIVKCKTFDNFPRKISKTSDAEDRLMVRMSKADFFLPSTQVRLKIESNHNVQIQ